MATYAAETATYNAAAMKLFSGLGMLQCPSCVKSQERRQRKEASSSFAIVGEVETATDKPGALASSSEGIFRTFLSVAGLIAHMRTCCPSDVPEGDVESIKVFFFFFQISHAS